MLAGCDEALGEFPECSSGDQDVIDKGWTLTASQRSQSGHCSSLKAAQRGFKAADGEIKAVTIQHRVPVNRLLCLQPRHAEGFLRFHMCKAAP